MGDAGQTGARCRLIPGGQLKEMLAWARRRACNEMIPVGWGTQTQTREAGWTERSHNTLRRPARCCKGAGPDPALARRRSADRSTAAPGRPGPFHRSPAPRSRAPQLSRRECCHRLRRARPVALPPCFQAACSHCAAAWRAAPRQWGAVRLERGPRGLWRRRGRRCRPAPPRASVLDWVGATRWWCLHCRCAGCPSRPRRPPTAG